MTARQIKAKAPFFWQAVEGAVYIDCKRTAWSERINGIGALSQKACEAIARNAAYIATSEFVSRAKK